VSLKHLAVNDTIDLRWMLAALRRRRLVIAACTLIAAATALGLSLLQDERYSASASLLFRDPGLDQKLFGSTYLPPSRDPDREAATNVELVSLRVVSERAARRLGPGVDADAVRSRIDIHARGRSDVVVVTATDRDPRAAARLANLFAEEYVGFRRAADRAKIRDAQALVERQLAAQGIESNGREAESLRSRAQELRVLAALQTGNAEVVQEASAPTAPSSPRVVRNTVLGGVLGLLLALAGTILHARLDRRIREPDELEEAFGLPVLAGVPESPALRARPTDAREVAPLEAEAFFLLRAQLRYFNVDRDIRSVLITSAAAQDGKSTVAYHLALAAATAGSGPVLLLEADLRRPTLAREHGFAHGPGLAELLSRDLSFEEVVQRVRGSDEVGQPLDVMIAGATPPNPAELIDSDRMAHVLTLAAERYAFVVVDTPPIPAVSDAIPLVRKVSGVIVVSRLGKTTRDAALALSRTLRNLEAPTLGVVANGIPRAQARGYAYDYYVDPVASPSDSPA
jgi:capsular exopolysaccharide synthesis family protein